MRRVGHLGWLSLVLVGVGGAGFLAWPVTAPMQWACHQLSKGNGWQLTLGEARWIPWRNLEVEDLRLSTPHGGRMHVVRIWIVPKLGSLLEGGLATLWNMGEIRMDPGSWGIREPEAQGLLSGGPVTTEGQALVRFHTGQVTLEDLSLKGPLLQMEAQGWLADRSRARLEMKGRLARSVLEGMRLVKVEEAPDHRPWEPFEVTLSGLLDRPDIDFRSDFLTFSMKSRKDPSS